MDPESMPKQRSDTLLTDIFVHMKSANMSCAITSISTISLARAMVIHLEQPTKQRWLDPESKYRYWQ